MSSIKVGIILSAFLISANVSAFDRADLHKTSFERKTKRYPSVLTVLENLRQIAPFQKPVQQKSDIDSCLLIGDGSANILGANDPGTGQPLENEPGALFFNYFEKCTQQIVKLGFSESGNAKKNAELILGNDLSKALGNMNWSTTAFSQIPAEMQNQVVDRFIFYVLGPEELLLDFKYIGAGNVLNAPLQTAADLRDFLKTNIIKVNANESLLGFYARTAAFLRLGPALKN